MWKLTAYAKTRRPITGVNWRDLTDEEYEAALAANPGMDQRGYFEHVEEAAQAEQPVKTRVRRAEESTDG